MILSILTSLVLITCSCGLYFLFATTEGTLDHFKLNKKSTAAVNFMHPVYIARNLLLLFLVSISVIQGLLDIPWYYFLLEALACLFFYIPIHDGFYYTTRNKWKPDSYKGFWMGVDSHPANKFMKEMNEPTMRIFLFVFACFCIIFITTYEPFM